MDKDRKVYIMKKLYSPYRRESLVYLIYDFIALAIIALTVAMSPVFVPEATGGEMFKLAVLLIACHGSISCTIFHGITLLSFFEIRNQKWKRQRLTIKRVINVPSFSGGRLDDNPISKLYPANMYVCRYWLICRNETGGLVILRSVMSEKKVLILCDQLRNATTVCCDISYGPCTRVVFRYHSTDEWADLLNHLF